MKVLTFGSCLSAYTSDHLSSDYGVEKFGQVVHNRSDAFSSKYIDKTAPLLPPYEKLVEALKPKNRDAHWYFKNQEITTMGAHGASEEAPRLPELLKSPIDIILLDNFMDLAAKLVRVDHPSFFEPFELFMNMHEYDEEIGRFIQFKEFLSAGDSAENWVKIYRYLRERQPQAKIFFLCFQYEQSRKDRRRYEVGRQFYHELVARCPEGLSIVPPLAVPMEMTKGVDEWQHFQPAVYKALAGHVYLSALAGLPGVSGYKLPPSFFD